MHIQNKATKIKTKRSSSKSLERIPVRSRDDTVVASKTDSVNENDDDDDDEEEEEFMTSGHEWIGRKVKRSFGTERQSERVVPCTAVVCNVCGRS